MTVFFSIGRTRSKTNNGSLGSSCNLSTGMSVVHERVFLISFLLLPHTLSVADQCRIVRYPVRVSVLRLGVCLFMQIVRSSNRISDTCIPRWPVILTVFLVVVTSSTLFFFPFSSFRLFHAITWPLLHSKKEVGQFCHNERNVYSLGSNPHPSDL